LDASFLYVLSAAVAVTLLLGPVAAVGVASLFRLEPGAYIVADRHRLRSHHALFRDRGHAQRRGNALWALALHVLLCLPHPVTPATVSAS